jgi:hypothetical protein
METHIQRAKIAKKIKKLIDELEYTEHLIIRDIDDRAAAIAELLYDLPVELVDIIYEYEPLSAPTKTSIKLRNKKAKLEEEIEYLKSRYKHYKQSIFRL